MGPSSERKKVAVFDPVGNSRRLLEELLQGMGYVVDPHRTIEKIASRLQGKKAADLLVINFAILGETYQEVTAALQEIQADRQGAPPIVGVTMLSLSQEARARLEQLGVDAVLSHSAQLMELIFEVNRRLFPKIRELRRYARVFGGFPVQFLHEGQWLQGQVYNISQEGAFIQCEAPPPENAMLTIRFVLPGMDVTLETQGMVNWVNQPIGEQHALSPRGMGINFLTMGQTEATTLERFIADRVNHEMA
jgi:CheY-like chemotaxis protein